MLFSFIQRTGTVPCKLTQCMAQQVEAPSPPPFTPAEAAAKLRDEHGATDFKGDGPPTETSVGLRKREDWEALPAAIWVLLSCLASLREVSFYGCKALKTLPEGVHRTAPSPSPPRPPTPLHNNWCPRTATATACHLSQILTTDAHSPEPPSYRLA